MFYPLSIYRPIRPKEKHIWAQIRILHETDEAKNNIFEIYGKESTVTKYQDFTKGAIRQQFMFGADLRRIPSIIEIASQSRRKRNQRNSAQLCKLKSCCLPAA